MVFGFKQELSTTKCKNPQSNQYYTLKSIKNPQSSQYNHQQAHQNH